jgi:hypothetical protein
MRRRAHTTFGANKPADALTAPPLAAQLSLLASSDAKKKKKEKTALHVMVDVLAPEHGMTWKARIPPVKPLQAGIADLSESLRNARGNCLQPVEPALPVHGTTRAPHVGQGSGPLHQRHGCRYLDKSGVCKQHGQPYEEDGTAQRSSASTCARTTRPRSGDAAPPISTDPEAGTGRGGERLGHAYRRRDVACLENRKSVGRHLAVCHEHVHPRVARKANL